MTPQQRRELSADSMTIRDEFAIRILAAQLSCQTEESGFYTDFVYITDQAYNVADVMLARRTKELENNTEWYKLGKS